MYIGAKFKDIKCWKKNVGLVWLNDKSNWAIHLILGKVSHMILVYFFG